MTMKQPGHSPAHVVSRYPNVLALGRLVTMNERKDVKQTIQFEKDRRIAVR